MSLDVQIVPLTTEIANRLRTLAALALNGDGKCSLRTMSTSCFAAEHCATVYHSAMQLDQLLTRGASFVALVRAPNSQDDVFAGCVSANLASDNSLCQRHFFYLN